jgi:hypothetical protein
MSDRDHAAGASAARWSVANELSASLKISLPRLGRVPTNEDFRAAIEKHYARALVVNFHWGRIAYSVPISSATIMDFVFDSESEHELFSGIYDAMRKKHTLLLAFSREKQGFVVREVGRTLIQEIPAEIAPST